MASPNESTCSEKKTEDSGTHQYLRDRKKMIPRVKILCTLDRVGGPHTVSGKQKVKMNALQGPQFL